MDASFGVKSGAQVVFEVFARIESYRRGWSFGQVWNVVATTPSARAGRPWYVDGLRQRRSAGLRNLDRSFRLERL